MIRELERPAPPRGRLETALYQAERGAYPSLNIVDDIIPAWTFSFVVEGEVVTQTRGTRQRVRPGDVMVHPPHLPFSEYNPGPGVHLWIAFDLAVPPQGDLLRQHPIAPVVTLIDPESYLETFWRLHAAFRASPSVVQSLRIPSLLVEMVALVIESWQAGGAPPRPDDWQTPEDRFRDIVIYLSEHLAERVTREDLARRAFLHPGSFDRAFRRIYGVAPMQMLRDLRLNRVRHLLESTDEGLEAIAAATGFGDAPTLSRAFRAAFQTPPGSYRRMIREARTPLIPVFHPPQK